MESHILLKHTLTQKFQTFSTGKIFPSRKGKLDQTAWNSVVKGAAWPLKCLEKLKLLPPSPAWV